MKVNSKIGTPRRYRVKNWSKSQLVTCDNSGLVLLTTGVHTEKTFTGVILTDLDREDNLAKLIYNDWDKKSFYLLPSHKKIILQND